MHKRSRISAHPNHTCSIAPLDLATGGCFQAGRYAEAASERAILQRPGHSVLSIMAAAA